MGRCDQTGFEWKNTKENSPLIEMLGRTLYLSFYVKLGMQYN